MENHGSFSKLQREHEIQNLDSRTPLLKAVLKQDCQLKLQGLSYHPGYFQNIYLESLIFLLHRVKDLLLNLLKNFKETDFAITDLSHSKAIIEIEGQEVKEVLKKGCPFNFNSLEKNNSINSTYNGIAFTVDLLKDNPDKARLFALRSFGESLYHSITDASLEFGFRSL